MGAVTNLIIVYRTFHWPFALCVRRFTFIIN